MLVCVESLLLCLGFLQLQQAAAILHGVAPLLLVVACLVIGTQGLDRVGSAVVSLRLSCPVAGGASSD